MTQHTFHNITTFDLFLEILVDVIQVIMDFLRNNFERRGGRRTRMNSNESKEVVLKTSNTPALTATFYYTFAFHKLAVVEKGVIF